MMLETFILRALRNGPKRIPIGLGFALALTFLHQNASARQVNLGTANKFAVLAYSAISSTAGPSAISGGNVGLYPDGLSSITGTIAITPPYTTYAADGFALTAKNDLTTAYNQAAGLAPTANLTSDVLGVTVGTAIAPLTPGVYFFSSSAQLTGTLYLNDEGEKDPFFDFQIGTTLITASSSSVVELNQGAGTILGSSIFWQVGSSATLGTYTAFDGNILAYTSITDDGYSTVNGRLLAMGGAVTLDYTTIVTPPAEKAVGQGVPDTGGTLLLLGSGLGALLAFGRRVSFPGLKPCHCPG
jgi:hypothetical protein